MLMFGMLASVAFGQSAKEPGALLEAGMAAQKAGDVAKALEQYQACLQVDPDHVACHWEIGWSHWTRSE